MALIFYIQNVVDKNKNMKYNKIAQQNIFVLGGKMGNKVFSERIKKLRIDSNMTMDMLAKKLNITKSRISMWENNGTVPREDILLELSKLYNVSIDYLLGNDKMEGQEPDKGELKVLQRGLSNLNEEDLKKAKTVLEVMFDNIFAEEEDHGDL